MTFQLMEIFRLTITSCLIGWKSQTAALLRMSSRISCFVMILIGFSSVTSSSQRQWKISCVLEERKRGTTPSGTPESESIILHIKFKEFTIPSNCNSHLTVTQSISGLAKFERKWNLTYHNTDLR